MYNFSKILFASLMFLASCKEVDKNTKKQIKKEGKQLAKQVSGALNNIQATESFVNFEANKNTTQIKMYWKDDAGNILGSLQNVQKYAASKGDSLLYACNGGMYMQDQAPLGAFVQNNQTIKKFNLGKGSGNFYLKPKGVFYIQKGGLPIVRSIEAQANRDLIIFEKVNCLTQSGPMLVTKGVINPLFKKESANLNIRNGVGILPNGNTYFAMSALPVNFYDFAKHFADKGCKNALYLDGFVSRTYLPSKSFVQLDGEFGVVIGVVKRK